MKRYARMLAVATAVVLTPMIFAVATPAFADSHTVTLSVGPVSLPGLPVSACIDGTCVSTPVLTSVGVSVTATTDTSVAPTLAAVSCPNGGLGVAVVVTTATSVSVTISALVTGTSPDGPVSVPVGPETVTVSTPGVIVSACTF
jgi:hypothetical protein